MIKNLGGDIMAKVKEVDLEKAFIRKHFKKLYNSTDDLTCVMLTDDEDIADDAKVKSITAMLILDDEGDFFRTVQRGSKTYGNLLVKLNERILEQLDENDYSLDFDENMTTEEKVKIIKSDYKKIAKDINFVKNNIAYLIIYVYEYFDRLLRCYGEGLLDD
jgi:hypothetical protein